jgi:hypothetical protein
VHAGAGALQAAAGLGVAGLAQQDAPEKVGGLTALTALEELEAAGEPALEGVRRRLRQAPRVLT